MHKTTALIILVSTAVFFFGCSDRRTKTGGLPSPVPEPEEYEVYSFLLEGENAVIKKDDDDIIVIEGDTVPTYVVEGTNHGIQTITRKGSYLYGFNETLSIPEIGWDTLDDFERKNMSPSTLDYQFDLKTKYLLFNHEEQLELGHAGSYWDRFYTRYPDSHGRISFSRVGFNRDKTKALVYRGWLAGSLAGGGHVVFLSKVDDRWIVKKRIAIWIS